jgi:hypothetical protein
VPGQKIERVDLDDNSQKAVDKWQVFMPMSVLGWRLSARQAGSYFSVSDLVMKISWTRMSTGY